MYFKTIEDLIMEGPNFSRYR